MPSERGDSEIQLLNLTGVVDGDGDDGSHSNRIGQQRKWVLKGSVHWLRERDRFRCYLLFVSFMGFICSSDALF